MFLFVDIKRVNWVSQGTVFDLIDNVFSNGCEQYHLFNCMIFFVVHAI